MRAAFDEDAADTLMSALPRDPLAQVNARIDVLEANLRGEIKAANSELLRTLFFGMIVTNATLVGLVFAAAQLA